MASHSRQGSASSLRITPSPSPSVTAWKPSKSEKKGSRMGSPLSSPTLAASTAKLRNRVPTQVRRCLPLYLACVALLLIFLNFDIFYSIPTPHSLRPKPQKIVPPPPREIGGSFPQKIWQTWKVNMLDFEEHEAANAKTWLEKNPKMRYEVLTDANEMSYVEEQYGPYGLNRPDIVQFYRSLNLPIVKADLLRYMVMYAEGGIYTDIDVEALKPFQRFIPPRYNERDIDMVVGVEVDQPEFKDHPILGKKSMSFCQWTLISRPRQPIMLRLVEDIMKWLTDVAHKQGVPISDVELDFDQVISGTGPSAFTKAVLEEMNRKTKNAHVTWDTFHNLDESKVVGGVLVLNVEAFCAGQGHSDSGNHNARGALVKHHYHASNWPSRHPRFSHPAYGQVEDCNWEAECVRQWDENVAKWDELTEDEQEQKIAERAMFLEALLD